MNTAGPISRQTFESALLKRKNREDLCILIVEDQKFSRLMLKNFLAKNYTVIDVSSGEEALAQYVSHAPDIVFLDIELPKVGGQQVLKLITQLDKDSFVVMVTANNNSSDVQNAIEGGARGFIAKPYTKINIYEVIDRYLEERNRYNKESKQV